MNLKTLLDRYTVDQLKAAIRLSGQRGRVEALQKKKDALLNQVQKIDRKLAKLNGGNGATMTAAKPGRRKGWKLSKATREKMRQAALRRFGKVKGKAPAAGKRKRKPLSPETKAKMRAAALKRWSKVKGTPEATEGK